MAFSRRHFLKAAGAGTVTVTATVGAVVAGVEAAIPQAKPSPLTIIRPRMKCVRLCGK